MTETRATTWKTRLWLPAPVALAVATALPQEWDDGRLLVWAPYVRPALLIAAVAWCKLLADRTWTRHVLGRLPAAAAAGQVMISTLCAVLQMCRQHPVVAEETLEDGSTYLVTAVRFDETSYTLARRTSNWGPVKAYEILARRRWDRGPKIARPMGLPDRPLVLHRRWVVANTTGYWLAASVDGVAWDDDGVSPFVMIGPDDRIVKCDVDAIVEFVSQTHSPSWVALPADADLVEALASPNPSIRDAAARIVGAGGPALFPESTKRLP